MKRAILVLALCLCALPAMHARSLSEEELLESTALLLESANGLTSEEQTLLASGTYGSGGFGYGGLFAGDDADSSITTDLQLESAGASGSSSASPSGAAGSSPSGAQANTAAKAAASAAMPADKSTALLAAGMIVAVSALLL